MCSTKPFFIPVMHELCFLELFGNSFSTRVVLMSILDNCPSLKSLTISGLPYPYSRNDEELQNKLARIKDVSVPYDDSDSDEE